MHIRFHFHEIFTIVTKHGLSSEEIGARARRRVAPPATRAVVQTSVNVGVVRGVAVSARPPASPWLRSLPQILSYFSNFPSHQNHIEILNIANNSYMEY